MLSANTQKKKERKELVHPFLNPSIHPAHTCGCSGYLAGFGLTRSLAYLLTFWCALYLVSFATVLHTTEKEGEEKKKRKGENWEEEEGMDGWWM